MVALVQPTWIVFGRFKTISGFLMGLGDLSNHHVGPQGSWIVFWRFERVHSPPSCIFCPGLSGIHHAAGDETGSTRRLGNFLLNALFPCVDLVGTHYHLGNVYFCNSLLSSSIDNTSPPGIPQQALRVIRRLWTRNRVRQMRLGSYILGLLLWVIPLSHRSKAQRSFPNSSI